MSRRYFVETSISGTTAVLAGQEAHHLLHVMRARIGEEVVLFDGSGAEFPARVEALERQQVRLAVLDRQEINRELAVSLTLGVALPKGDRQKWLVEKITELGVARLTPLSTAHVVAQPVACALDRLRRGVIEASKQCGRNRLLQIAKPQDWPDFIAAAPQSALKFLAHPGGPPASEVLTRTSPADSVWLAVGPEGGFTDSEIALARTAGWQTVGLGERILRVETAAIWLAALAAIAIDAGPQ
ncbi:MAG: 16S rRNA (uracil(1498)-N(3))-methyltransferase [Planctomycetes bacterium]|nr:16S rRNA (uracil(1498)-N(3))-methyltransferase [Planctomycetota bacterium]